MKIQKKLISAFLLATFLFQNGFNYAFAAASPPDNVMDVNDSCEGVNLSGSLSSEFILGDAGSFNFSLSGLVPRESYRIYFRDINQNVFGVKLLAEQVSNNSGETSFTISDPEIFPETTRVDGHQLILNGDLRDADSSCILWEYKVVAQGACEISSIEQKRNGQACFFGDPSDQNSCIDRSQASIDAGKRIFVHVSNVRKGNQLYINDKVTVRIDGGSDDEVGTTNGAGNVTTDHSLPGVGSYTIRVYEGNGLGSLLGSVMCSKSFSVSIDCANRCMTDKPVAALPGKEVVGALFELCAQIPNDTQKEECQKCAREGEGGGDNQAGIWTAIGCIKRSPTAIIQRLVKLGLGIGGGVSLIMTLAGGFILSVSKGDPKRTGQAKEMITNAIIGIIFVIFSVTILQFMGYTVLKIPGFGTK